MKREQLFEAIGDVCEDLLVHSERNSHIPVMMKWGGWSVAAVLAVIVGCLVFQPHNDEMEYSTQDLKQLTISDETDGMGFEGLMAYDVSELVYENVWTEDTDLTVLPVYENMRAYNENHEITGTSLEEMEEFAKEVVTCFGLEWDGIPSDQIKTNDSNITINTDEMKISIDKTMTATISFNPSISLPKDYNFKYGASYDEFKSVASFLKEEYSSILKMENPTVNISGGDYDINNDQNYTISFFDKSGSVEEQIIHYNFHNVTFYSDDDGNLYLIRIFSQDLSHEVGNYPIITKKEAQKLLSEGTYMTSVPEEFPGTDFIRKVELIYRTGNSNKYYMPYYRFYVELSGMEGENGMKMFGIYYVPAVEEQYIKNMPKWDGTFNN